MYHRLEEITLNNDPSESFVIHFVVATVSDNKLRL